MEHSELVRNLVKSGDQIVQEMTGEKAHLLHMMIGVCGEAGELLDAIKKHVVYGKSLDVANVLEELGDIEFYLEGFRQGLQDAGHTTLGRTEILDMNQTKLLKRYGSGAYSNDQAIARADKINIESLGLDNRPSTSEHDWLMVGKLIHDNFSSGDKGLAEWLKWTSLNCLHISNFMLSSCIEEWEHFRNTGRMEL